MISDNELPLSTSGDEDVDYTAPKTPCYCPPTDTEEHMAEDKQNNAYGKASILNRNSRGESVQACHIFCFLYWIILSHNF